MDDQWALSHLALSPELDIRGVVGAQAPVLVTIDEDGIMGPQHPAPDAIAQATAEVVRTTLAVLPISSPPPVYAGSNTPILDRDTPSPSVGSEFIIETSHGFSTDNRLAILVIGPATDVASALLIDPTLEDRIDVIAMAYNTWPEGTDLFNVKNDIASWQVLMASQTPITVGDWAVCKTHLTMTGERARSFFSKHGTPGMYLINLLVSWLDHQGDKATALVDDATAWSIWDQVTVAHILGLTTTETHPRPILRDDMSFEHPDSNEASGRTINWITAVDEATLWADFARKLGEAMKTK